MDLGSHPVDREGDEPHADIRVEAFDRLHQPDIALLDQIGLRETVPVIAAGDADDEAQVSGHQLPCGIQITFVAISLGQLPLLLHAEHREREDRLPVRREVSDREGVGRQLQCCAHFIHLRMGLPEMLALDGLECQTCGEVPAILILLVGSRGRTGTTVDLPPIESQGEDGLRFRVKSGAKMRTAGEVPRIGRTRGVVHAVSNPRSGTRAYRRKRREGQTA